MSFESEAQQAAMAADRVRGETSEYGQMANQAVAQMRDGLESGILESAEERYSRLIKAEVEAVVGDAQAHISAAIRTQLIEAGIIEAGSILPEIKTALGVVLISARVGQFLAAELWSAMSAPMRDVVYRGWRVQRQGWRKLVEAAGLGRLPPYDRMFHYYVIGGINHQIWDLHEQGGVSLDFAPWDPRYGRGVSFWDRVKGAAGGVVNIGKSVFTADIKELWRQAGVGLDTLEGGISAAWDAIVNRPRGCPPPEVEYLLERGGLKISDRGWPIGRSTVSPELLRNRPDLLKYRAWVGGNLEQTGERSHMTFPEVPCSMIQDIPPIYQYFWAMAVLSESTGDADWDGGQLLDWFERAWLSSVHNAFPSNNPNVMMHFVPGLGFPMPFRKGLARVQGPGPGVKLGRPHRVGRDPFNFHWGQLMGFDYIPVVTDVGYMSAEYFGGQLGTAFEGVPVLDTVINIPISEPEMLTLDSYVQILKDVDAYRGPAWMSRVARIERGAVGARAVETAKRIHSGQLELWPDVRNGLTSSNADVQLQSSMVVVALAGAADFQPLRGAT